MSISHKKFNLLTEKLNELLVDSNEENRKLFLEFMKQTLNYNEKHGTYDKEKYEKYRKPYYEKNKEKINKSIVEKRRNKRLEYKNVDNNETSLNIINN